jgi:hypothetical protein
MSWFRKRANGGMGRVETASLGIQASKLSDSAILTDGASQSTKRRLSLKDDLAIYNLEKQPTTFDFATWAVIAKTLGVKHVHFGYDGVIQTWKYTADVAWKRFANILLPICKMAGFSWSLGAIEKPGVTFPYHYGHAEKVFQKLGYVEKLKPTYEWADKDYITITIRESIRNKWRDSNKKAWERFADKAGKKVVMVPDAETSPFQVDLEYRMALYAGADMNLGVNNGPMSLCHFSDAPYLTFMKIPDVGHEQARHLVKHMEQINFGPGSQFGFRNEKQLLVWQDDTYSNILRAYEDVMGIRKILLPD